MEFAFKRKQNASARIYSQPMTNQERRSRYYLERNTPEQRLEAVKVLKWAWSSRALELLTRYPRRSAPSSVLTIDEVQRLNLHLRQPSNFFTEFQRELGGVTYCTYKEDGNWATWGLTYLEDPENEDEWMGPDIHVCYDEPTSIVGYCLAGDGQLWGEFPEAQNVTVEIERIALKFELHSLFSRSVSRWIGINGLRVERQVMLPALTAIFNNLHWSIVAETQDIYSSIWRSSSGWAYYSSAHESNTHLFFFGAFADTDEAIYFKETLISSLPDHEIIF